MGSSRLGANRRHNTYTWVWGNFLCVQIGFCFLKIEISRVCCSNTIFGRAIGFLCSFFFSGVSVAIRIPENRPRLRITGSRTRFTTMLSRRFGHDDNVCIAYIMIVRTHDAYARVLRSGARTRSTLTVIIIIIIIVGNNRSNIFIGSILTGRARAPAHTRAPDPRGIDP